MMIDVQIVESVRRPLRFQTDVADAARKRASPWYRIRSNAAF